MTKLEIILTVVVVVNGVATCFIYRQVPTPLQIDAIARRAVEEKENQLVQRYGDSIKQIQSDFGINGPPIHTLDDLLHAVSTIVLMPDIKRELKGEELDRKLQ